MDMQIAPPPLPFFWSFSSFLIPFYYFSLDKESTKLMPLKTNPVKSEIAQGKKEIFFPYRKKQGVERGREARWGRRTLAAVAWWWIRPSFAFALWWRSSVQQAQPREEPCEEA